jgi:hypothetical protein
MKYIKTYEAFEETAKDEINNMVNIVNVGIDKTYLNNGDKEYSYIISEESKKYVSYKIIKFIETIFGNKLNIEPFEILSFLDELTAHEEELDENSINSVTQDIYNYIDELSDYELEDYFKLSQSTKKFNL